VADIVAVADDEIAADHVIVLLSNPQTALRGTSRCDDHDGPIDPAIFRATASSSGLNVICPPQMPPLTGTPT